MWTEHPRPQMRRVVTTRNVAGFLYTQWRDVETETNGLLDAARTLKWDVDRIRAAVTRLRPASERPGGRSSA
jgi:hypothetical protein